MIEVISAITLGTHDMARAVRFYRALGFDLPYGGEAAAFTSFRAGSGYLNLTAQPEDKRWSWWGRAIFYVADVDALHARALAAGYQPSTQPRRWRPSSGPAGRSDPGPEPHCPPSPGRPPHGPREPRRSCPDSAPCTAWATQELSETP